MRNKKLLRRFILAGVFSAMLGVGAPQVMAANQDWNPDAVISKFSAVLENNPQNAVAHQNRGAAYLRKGQLQKAIEDFTQAIALQPGYADAYNNRANAYWRMGNKDKALADLDNLPDPDVLADDIIENLQSALESFQELKM